ncbi:MAG: hypothetical protein IJF96_02575 [Firmicutes bacterium]|nr:hypothetical protein [Bacillota bacterium]
MKTHTIMQEKGNRNAGKKTASFVFFICVFLLLASVSPLQAEATSFSDRKPKGLVVTAARGRIAVTWEKVKGAHYYIVYEKRVRTGQGHGPRKSRDGRKLFSKVVSTKSCKTVRKHLKKGWDYCYYVEACRKVNKKIVKSRWSVIRMTTLPKKGRSTIKNLLRTGLAPMGSTMYVWGGGWNRADTAAGPTVRRTGLYPDWRKFAAKHMKNYDYTKHLYEIKKGLDCSGFAGFCIYNVMNTKNGKKGYVKKSTWMSKWLSKKGLGSYRSASTVKTHKAGDVMSCKGHVWIAVGDCSDGSAVVMHSSPPAVSLAGTPSKSGKKNSKAVKLARKYMKKYHPGLYRKYPEMVYRDKTFLKRYNRMRWYKSILSDPDGYRGMSAEKVLADLFSER